jgi:hypothetical protein
MAIGLKVISTIASMDFPCLFAQNGLVSLDHQGLAMIIPQNCWDKDFTIFRCSNNGYIGNTNNPYFDEISELKTKYSANKNLQNLNPC